MKPLRILFALALVLACVVPAATAQQKAATPQAAPPKEAPVTAPAKDPSTDNILRTSTGEITVEGYDPNRQYVGIIETEYGTIALEFWPDVAPNHVKNFISLAKKGFYNGVVFHRAVPGFMIQGGDPTGTGSGGPGYKINAEFNEKKHVRGVLSMARTPDPNSAGSQFFIMHGDAPFLDRQYSAFGKALSGLEVVDKIVNMPTKNQLLLTPVKMNKVTIVEKSQYLSTKDAKPAGK